MAIVLSYETNITNLAIQMPLESSLYNVFLVGIFLGPFDVTKLSPGGNN